MTIQELIFELQRDCYDPDANAAPIVRKLLAKPRAAPAIPPDKFDPTPRDTSTMTDAQVRKYFASRALYDDTDFHTRQRGPFEDQWSALRLDIRRAGQTQSAKLRRDQLRQAWREWIARTYGWRGASEGPPLELSTVMVPRFGGTDPRYPTVGYIEVRREDLP